MVLVLRFVHLGAAVRLSTPLQGGKGIHNISMEYSFNLIYKYESKVWTHLLILEVFIIFTIFNIVE